MNLRTPQLLNWYSSTIMSSHISLFSVSLATVAVHHSVYSIAYLTRDRVRAQKKDDSTRSFVQKIRMIMAVTMTNYDNGNDNGNNNDNDNSKSASWLNELNSLI